jgi:hypothetical protein
MLMFVIQHQPHRALAHFRGELVRRLAHHGPILSGVGASGKPGAVHLVRAKAIWGERSTAIAASRVIRTAPVSAAL